MLKRTELVALFNTLARISGSLEAINSFRIMVEEQETEAESEGHHHVMSDRIRKPHNVVVDKPLSNPVEEDYVDHEREEALRRTRLSDNATFSEQVNAELGLMWKVFKYIIRGWVTAPINL